MTRIIGAVESVYVQQYSGRDRKTWVRNHFPKYHCELNFIELLWGWTKSYHRRQCTYSFLDLKADTGLMNTLEHKVPLPFIRKCARRCFRYAADYTVNCVGPKLEFVVKKYKSHRKIRDTSAAELDAEYEKFKVKKEETSKKRSV